MPWCILNLQSLENIFHLNARHNKRIHRSNQLISWFTGKKLCWHRDSNPQPSNPVVLHDCRTFLTGLGVSSLRGRAPSGSKYSGGACSNCYSHCFSHQHSNPKPVHLVKLLSTSFTNKLPQQSPAMCIKVWPERLSVAPSESEMAHSGIRDR